MKLQTELEDVRHLNNRRYREWYRKKLPKYYSPVLHVAFNLLVLLSLIATNFYLVSNWNFPALGMIIFVALFGNVTVYLLHRYPLHKRLKFWPYPYQAHTIEHHRYYTSDFLTYDDRVDFGVVFFPMQVIAGFALFAQPGFFFLSREFFGNDLAHVFAGATAGYFLMYEFFHWASHLPDNHMILRVPWISYMRDHHRAHHNPKLMNKYNFCIVYPLMDIIMGTKYKGNLPVDDTEDHYHDVKCNLS